MIKITKNTDGKDRRSFITKTWLHEVFRVAFWAFEGLRQQKHLQIVTIKYFCCLSLLNYTFPVRWAKNPMLDRLLIMAGEQDLAASEGKGALAAPSDFELLAFVRGDVANKEWFFHVKEHTPDQVKNYVPV